MTPLFNSQTQLVGWLADNKKYIFDTNLNWVAFIDNNNIWTTKNKNWVGVLYGNNIRDTFGNTAFWNPDTPIENSLKPLNPLKPLTPLSPLKPLKPLNPLRPLKPLTPIGGWSIMTWEQFIFTTIKRI